MVVRLIFTRRRQIVSQHYAFLIGEADFDQVFGRIKERALDYWPIRPGTRAQEINRNDGGRGLYFQDPDGHLLEVITAPTAAAASQN